MNETEILSLLEERYKIEQQPFEYIFDQYQLVVTNLSQQTTLVEELRFEIAKTRLTREEGSNQSHSKSLELEAQISLLKDEQTSLYKTQAANATQLLEYFTKTSEFEQTMKTLQKEINSLNKTIKSLNKKIEEQDSTLLQKNNDLKMLSDELNVYRLELTMKEKNVDELNEKIHKLKAENGELIERIVKIKEEQVSKLNDANEYVETTLRTSRTPSKASFPNLPDDREKQRTKSGCRSSLPLALVKKFAANTGETHCIQLSRDGQLLATGGFDKKLNLYDSTTGVLSKSLSGSLQGIMSISFSPQNDVVLGTSNDNSIKLWNISTSRLTQSLTGHIGKVYSARFTDSNKVISGSHDRSIKIWDLTKGYCMKTIFTISSCNDLVSLDSEGTVIASGHLDSTVRFWDTRSGNTIKELSELHSGQITSVEISPTGFQLLTTSRDNTLKLIDARTYETLLTFSNTNFKTGMNWLKSCFSPDGVYVASGGVDGSVFIWNSLNGKLEKQFSDHHKSAVCGVCWNPNGGSSVYSIEKDKIVCVWG